MELCLVMALAKDVCRGAVESAFLMLIKPANPVATMEVDTDFVGTNGRMVQFEMNLLIGISFAMNMQTFLNHLVFLPNVTSNMILSCCLVPHHSIIATVTFLLQNQQKFVVNLMTVCRKVGSSPVKVHMGLRLSSFAKKLAN